MKFRISLLTLCLCMLLVACNSNPKDTIDLLAPVGESGAELATTKEEKSNDNNDNEELSRSEHIDYLDETLKTTKTPSVTETPVCTQDVIPTILPQEEDIPKPTDILKPTVQPQETDTPIPTILPQETDTPKPTALPQVTDTPKPTVQPQLTGTPMPTAQPQVTNTPRPTSVPKPTDTPQPTSIPNDDTSSVKLNVRGTTISLGESKSSIIDKFGSPSRIDATEYNYEFYVYKNDYKKFMMIGIADDKVAAWYTDSNDFSYQGLSEKSGVSQINQKFGKNFTIKDTLSVTYDNTKITFFMDTLGDGTIEGIYVAGSAVRSDSTSKSVLTAWEKEVFDLTNSFRARNNYSILTWSDEAATSAKLHSEDMAENNYFSHNGLDGSTPFDRMKAQGITYTSAGENIIGGYGNAMFSNIGWVNSSGHRKNMLNNSFTNLGVGFTLGGSYGNYGTQNFFGK